MVTRAFSRMTSQMSSQQSSGEESHNTSQEQNLSNSGGSHQEGMVDFNQEFDLLREQYQVLKKNLEETRSSLERSQSSAYTESQRCQSLETHLQEMTSSFEETKYLAHTESQRCQSLEKDLKDTRLELKQTQATLKESDRKKNIAITALSKNNKADTLKLDDAFFKNLITDLRFSIKNWIAAQTLSLPKAHSVDSDATSLWVDMLAEVSPYWKWTVKHKKNALALLLQAFIWRHIVRMYDNDLWLGDAEEFDMNLASEPVAISYGYRLLKDHLYKSALLFYDSIVMRHY